MKIGIDTFGCEHGKSGQGIYLTNLISNLPQIPGVEFELFGSEIDKYDFTCGKELSFISVNIPDTIKAVRYWHYYISKKFIKKNKYDIVIYPAADSILPKKFTTDSVAIVTGLLTNSLSNLTKREGKWLKKGLNHASKIIAASNYIKSDLVKNGFQSKKIEVIKTGIDHKLFYPSLHNDNELVEIKPFSIMRPYFIYGSRLSDSDKKHEELIKAFNLFKKRTNYPHRLVISGTSGDIADKVQQIAFDSEFASDILMTGYFPHESFPQLYAGATACVFPAVNEGIGLPVLEAMACGVPVLCSNSGALKEIGGDIPFYFDSDNIDEIADCLQKIVEDEELCKQKISEGIQWTKKWNLEESVNKTIESVISLKMPKKSKKEKALEREKRIELKRQKRMKAHADKKKARKNKKNKYIESDELNG